MHFTAEALWMGDTPDLSLISVTRASFVFHLDLWAILPWCVRGRKAAEVLFGCVMAACSKVSFFLSAHPHLLFLCVSRAVGPDLEAFGLAPTFRPEWGPVAVWHRDPSIQSRNTSLSNKTVLLSSARSPFHSPSPLPVCGPSSFGASAQTFFFVFFFLPFFQKLTQFQGAKPNNLPGLESKSNWELLQKWMVPMR